MDRFVTLEDTCKEICKWQEQVNKETAEWEHYPDETIIELEETYLPKRLDKLRNEHCRYCIVYSLLTNFRD